jgi:sialate O-acetylesterase
MSNTWIPARDPLHRLYAAKAPAHRLINHWTPEKQAEIWYRENHRPAEKFVRGVGPGLSFARTIAKATGKPVGLIAAAHGGTSIRQWSPDAAGAGESSLYGALLARARRVGADGAGGKLRGLLWYQGENDAFNAGFITKPDRTTETVESYYTREFLNFVDRLRGDLKRPDLPIIYVQLARFHLLDPGKVQGWEAMRETQRRLMTMRANLWMVSGQDLPMDDSIHLSAAGQTRLGQRMANVALAAVNPPAAHPRADGATPIELERVEVLPGDPRSPITIYTIRVHFKHVNGRLRADGRPAGFTLRRVGVEGTRCNNIHRIDFDATDPAAINLLVQGPWVKDTQLLYGAGLEPYVNIVDDKDMALPAFGPLPLPEPAKKP